MSVTLSTHVPFSLPIAGTWCVRVLLALLPLGLATPASAATIYNFSFGSSVSGSFITDGASPDPGYELVTSMTFDFVTTRELVVYVGPFTTTSLEPGAAYNPTTGEFINHYSGSTYEDIGHFFLRGPSGNVTVQGNSFSLRGSLDGDFFVGITDATLLYGSLSVGPGVPVDAAAVPEPATLLLLGTGLLGAAAAQRRRMR